MPRNPDRSRPPPKQKQKGRKRSRDSQPSSPASYGGDEPSWTRDDVPQAQFPPQPVAVHPSRANIVSFSAHPPSFPSGPSPAPVRPPSTVHPSRTNLVSFSPNFPTVSPSQPVQSPVPIHVPPTVHPSRANIVSFSSQQSGPSPISSQPLSTPPSSRPSSSAPPPFVHPSRLGQVSFSTSPASRASSKPILQPHPSRSNVVSWAKPFEDSSPKPPAFGPPGPTHPTPTAHPSKLPLHPSRLGVVKFSDSSLSVPSVPPSEFRSLSPGQVESPPPRDNVLISDDKRRDVDNEKKVRPTWARPPQPTPTPPRPTPQPPVSEPVVEKRGWGNHEPVKEIQKEIDKEIEKQIPPIKSPVSSSHQPSMHRTSSSLPSEPPLKQPRISPIKSSYTVGSSAWSGWSSQQSTAPVYSSRPSSLSSSAPPHSSSRNSLTSSAPSSTGLSKAEEKALYAFRRDVVIFVREGLNVFYGRREINKDEYKVLCEKIVKSISPLPSNYQINDDVKSRVSQLISSELNHLKQFRNIK
ncbi:hypothetical protein RCL1_000403 [Eukaryota sp. TZLM3-RCL]